MDADIYKRTKINDIAYCSLQHHTRSQVLHIQYVAAQNRLRHILPGVTPRFLQLLHNVAQGHFTNAQRLRHFFIILYLFRNPGKFPACKILCPAVQFFQQQHCRAVALRMDAGSVKRISASLNAHKPGALFVCLRPQLCHFQKLFPLCKPAVLLSVCHDIFCNCLRYS